MAQMMTLDVGFLGSDIDSGCSREGDTSAENPLTPFDGDVYSDKEVRLIGKGEAIVDRENKFSVLQSEGTESVRSVSPARKKPRLALRKARSRISPTEWESVKDIISELYLEKDYTLKTVMDIMSKSPHNFQATSKMYKNQFEAWGFAKNLTNHRMKNILDPVSVKNKIVSSFNTVRIDRYLKRKMIRQVATITEPRADHNELPDNSFDALRCPQAPKASHNPFACKFMEKRGGKFSIALDGGFDHKHRFIVESWGEQEYHGFEERQCRQDCGCRDVCAVSCRLRHQHSHDFGVILAHRGPVVIIYNTRLISILCQAVPSLHGHLAPCEAFGARIIKGTFLLSCYRELVDFLGSYKPGITTAAHLLRLLVCGFIEDADMWLSPGVEKLHEVGHIDARLMNKFIQQRMMNGIWNLDTLFRSIDTRVERQNSPSNLWTEQVHEMEAPVESQFQLELWRRHHEQIHKTSCLPSPAALSDSLIRCLPGHFILDNFDEDLVQDFPQLLPTVSRGDDFPIVFSDELSNSHTHESFARVEPDTRAQEQTDLDTKLVAACRSGAMFSVKKLLGEGASPSCLVQVNCKIVSPIIAAIESRNESIVRLLVLSGANLEDKGFLESDGETLRYTALWAATRTKQATIIRLLLERGADLNGRSTSQSKATLRSFTCMSEAACLGLTEMFKLLLTWDTSWSEGLKETKLVHDLGPREADQAKRLFEEARSGSLPSFVQALEDVSNPNVLMSEGTPLSVAAQFNQPHKIKALLDRGADIQLASLYLSRSGQEQTAKALVKTVYGSQNIHVKFVKQYERLVRLSGSTNEEKLKSFRHQCCNYRQAWAIGIEVMQNICRGKPPDGRDRLHRILAFLAVARSVAETTIGETGDINLLDKFDTDLLRYQLLFPDSKDLSPYRLAVQRLWKVNLEGSFFLDLDFEDSDTLGRFNGLISRLIAGAQEPLGLGNSSGSGLNETLSRWKQRHQNDPRATAPAPTISPVQTNDAGQNAQEDRYLGTPPEVTASIPCEKVMTREMILKKTSWLDPGSKSATSVFFFEFTSVAEHLIRGIVFSIVFVFIHGLRSLARLYMENCFGLVERFTVLLRVLGFLEACERVSYRKVHDGTPKPLHEQDTVMEPFHLEGIQPATRPSNQWYDLISCSADIWI